MSDNIQLRLELSTAYKIPEEIEAKRIIDKCNFFLVDSDFLTVNRPIKNWIAESLRIQESYLNRNKGKEETKDLTFLDGVKHAYNILLSEISTDTDNLEQSLIDFVVPLIANYCADCKEKI